MKTDLESQILETFKTFQATAAEDPEYAENQIYKLVYWLI